jgi:ribonuclease E
MIMPSHAKNVKPYREPEPIFIKNNVERQLDAMYSPYVTLKSGGYIVINQTEALVAIDVNSGKATKQHSIEDTALRTNMEAAEEISRQLRLRDLAGLIVIDFIDMEERRNNRSVERKLKESLRHDRARIQIGRISAFGLLEMSRQRIRTGVLEGSTNQCPHCQGTGIIRSVESVALSVLRALEDYLRSNRVMDLTAVTSGEVALYILNNKREYLNDIEHRFGVRLGVVTDDRMQGSSFTIEKMSPDSGAETESNVVVQMDWGFEAPVETKAESEEDRKRSRRKRRRGRNGRKEADETVATAAVQPEEEAAEEDEEAHAQGDESEESQRARKSRRRGRRGGRRQRARRESGAETGVSEQGDDQAEAVGESAPREESAEAEPAEAVAEKAAPAEESAAPEPAEVVMHPRAEGAADVSEIEKAAEPAEPEAAAEPEAQPAEIVEMPAQQEQPPAEKPEMREPEPKRSAPEKETVTAEGEPERKEQRQRRRGWWQRR